MCILAVLKFLSDNSIMFATFSSISIECLFSWLFVRFFCFTCTVIVLLDVGHFVEDLSFLFSFKKCGICLPLDLFQAY